MPARAATKGERTRARIIESGLELFLAEGTANVSLRKIAGAAGVTPMAIYRYFDGKAALQLALLESAFELFESYLWEADRGGTPLGNLRSLAARFFAFALEREPQFRFLFVSDARPGGHDHEEQIKAISRPTFVMLRNAIRACQGTGELEVDDLHLATVDMLGFCVGQAALILSGNLDYQGGDAREHALAAFERYVAMMQP